MHRIIFSVLTLWLLTAASSLAQQAQSAWSTELQMKVKAVGSPQISPDGKLVAYTITDAVMTPDKSEYLTQIWLSSADGKEVRQLTFSDKSSTNPKWSPDGKAIAFLSNRKDNKNNLYLLRLGGGEAEPLTDVKASIADFEWSPDGRFIAFTMPDPKTDEEEKNEKGKSDYRWLDENTKLNRLYLVPVQAGASGKREIKKLTTEERSVSSFDWSPDSKRIVFSHTKSPSPNDWMTADLAIVEIESSKVTPFATTPAAETSPLFSPDGRSIAFLASDVPPRWAQDRTILVAPVTGGEPKRMPPSFDGQPNLAGWAADSRRLYFSEAKGTLSQIYAVDVAASKIEELKLPPAVYSSVSIGASGRMLAAVRQTSDTPQEVVIAPLTSTANPQQVSRANADLKLPPIGKTELIRWKSRDGQEIEGLLTYPVGYTPGKKVPLILNIHGGPAGVFQQTFNGSRSIYPIATFSAKGYAILRPNPRGSSGYGVAFRRANFKDWGGMDYQDLMAGVDRVIEMGVADPNRLGVMGWSYGGYMTSWIVTQTNRFKAASAGAPVTNLTSMTTTADIPDFIPDYFGGPFWEQPEVYYKHSPITHVKAVTTPTMIQHGTADVRVPISQGVEFYRALKMRGVPTRMLELPRQPHGPNEPKMMQIVMQTNLEWFEKYLGDAAAAAKQGSAP